MPIGTLTSKGQITVPKEIRPGRVVLKALNKDIRELKGIVRAKRRRPVSVEEMNGAIAAGFSRR